MRKLSSRGSWRILRRAALTVATSLSVALMTCAALIVAVNAGYLRRPVLDLIAGRLDRKIDVEGALTFKLLSRHPRIEAEGVTIGNPPWVQPGTMAAIDHVNIVLSLPGTHRRLELERLELLGATLNLVRDESGRANWQQSFPVKRAGAQLPMIRSLSMPEARVNLSDQRRHLQFRGVVSAGDQGSSAAAPLFEIRGGGILNDRPAGLDLLGEPLLGAMRDAPYKFSFDLRSSGSRVSGHGILPQAFDFAVIDAVFEAAGPDLKDLYLLTGVHLIDTGQYHLTGRIARRGFHTEFSELDVTSGGSDMQGTVAVDSGAPRRKLTIDLHSHVLRFADLGRRAASREIVPSQDPALLLSTSPLNVGAMRKADATVNFRLDRLVANHAVLEALSGKMTILQGRIDLHPVQGKVLDGSFNATLQIDAGLDEPAAVVEADFSELKLGQWTRQTPGQAPFEGSLRAHVELKGHGTSVHAVAASGTGLATVSLSSGAIREALAEIAGVDLRGVGLLLSHSKQDTAIRCARVRFDGRDGKFTASDIIVDTDPVLITGSGSVDFKSEALNLEFLGQPKSARLLRVDAPISMSGTLLRPVIGLRRQGARLKLIDRGHPTHVDCS